MLQSLTDIVLTKNTLHAVYVVWWELMRVDRLERWRSYEKMIEGGLLGGSKGRETDGVREEEEEGFKDPQQAVIEMD